jgi:hypothetical protein
VHKPPPYATPLLCDAIATGIRGYDEVSFLSDVKSVLILGYRCKAVASRPPVSTVTIELGRYNLLICIAQLSLKHLICVSELFFMMSLE